MLKNSFYRTLSYRTFAAGVLAALFTAGCAAEHKKFAEPAQQDWEKAQLGILYQVAEQEYKVGDYDKCRDALGKMIQAKTPFAPMHTLMAKVDLEGGSLDDAATQLKKAIEISPSDPEPYYLLGVVYQRWQKFDAAADYYQAAAAKKPDEAIYVLAVAEMRISLNQLDVARQYLLDKIMYFDQSAAMRVALAKIASLQGNHDQAVKYYRDATLLVPEDKTVRWSYAAALFDDGKYADTARILEDMRDDPPVPPKAPDSLAKQGDSASDDEVAQSAKVNLLMMLGESYISLKRPLDARDCFQDVIRIQPENMEAYLSLGKSCLLTHDLTLTLAAAQKVLRNQPDNVQAKILEAAVEQEQKKWSQALDTLSGIAQSSPQNQTVLCMLGWSEIQLGKKDAAADYLERAVAANPTDPWANELLSRVKPPAPQAAEEPETVPLPAAGPAGASLLEETPIPSTSSSATPVDSITNAAGTDLSGTPAGQAP